MDIYLDSCNILAVAEKIFEGVVVISREEKEFLEHIARRLDLLAEYVSACRVDSGIYPLGSWTMKKGLGYCQNYFGRYCNDYGFGS